MTAAGQFIVSLDCEGKWGMADHLQPYHHRLLTDEALRRVYEQLVDLLDRHRVPATFAFVMAFLLSEEERKRFAPQLLGDKRDEWLRAYQAEVSGGSVSGWHQPEALDLVQSAGAHEVACHGFCHRPLAEYAISETEAGAEIDAALEVARMKGLTLETFVFPRNQVGHVDVLRSRGFIGYRERLRRPGGAFGRALSLAEEINIWAPPQPASLPNHGIVAIPSGRFLNWRFGTRARIPMTTTVRRWSAQLRRAARDGGVVHLWLHPHNLITAPTTAVLLDAILSEAAALRDSGGLRILSQRDFCREQLSRAAVSKLAA